MNLHLLRSPASKGILLQIRAPFSDLPNIASSYVTLDMYARKAEC